MSGPKVINIEAVRRQQQRTCMSNVGAIRHAMERCLRVLEAGTPAAESFRQRAEETLKQLGDRQAVGDWATLVTESGALRNFYVAEVQTLRQAKAKGVAQTLQRQHRLQQGVEHWQASLQKLTPSAERDAILSRLASAPEEALSGIVAQAEAYCHATGIQERDASNTAELQKVAAGYVDHEAAAPPSKVLPGSEKAGDPRLERCWSILGELAAVSGPGVEALAARAQRVAQAPDQDRPLLLDSLVLEISSLLRKRREWEAVQGAAELLMVELNAFHSEEAAARSASLAEVLGPESTGMTVPVAEARVAEVRAWLEQEVVKETTLSQRAAVLRALASLGYEVREGMETAWVEQGRIVLRKPSESAYGVELSAPARGDAVQACVVALGAGSRNAQRDLEVETAWCGEFARMREMLAGDGFNTRVLHALAAGAVPLKVTETMAAGDAQRAAAAERKAASRTL